MLKGRVSTIDEEFEKGQDTPKLTKEESAEWLNMKIMNKAKDCIRYPGKDQKITLDAVTNRVYEGLVEDWGYNNIILNAMRMLKVDRAYIMAVIEILFDEDGEPIKPVSETGGSDVAKQTIAQPTAEPAYSEDGRASPYYTASLISIDEAHEAHDELEKAQVKGFIRTRKGKMERVNPFERKGMHGIMQVYKNEHGEPKMKGFVPDHHHNVSAYYGSHKEGSGDKEALNALKSKGFKRVPNRKDLYTNPKTKHLAVLHGGGKKGDGHGPGWSVTAFRERGKSTPSRESASSRFLENVGRRETRTSKYDKE